MRLITAAFAVLLIALPLSSQTADQNQQEILKELRAIRQLLEKLAASPPAPAAPAPGVVSDRVTLPKVIGNAMGKPNAPLTMIEFTDLQCPFCRQFALTTFPQIKKEYIDTGKLRFITRDFPLDTIHPLATPAARASWCAADQGKFWDMRHTVLVNNAQLTPDSFVTFARDLRMDVPAFEACVAKSGDQFQKDLQTDMADASAAGITAAPTFLIGRTTGGAFEGVRIVGAAPFADFDARLKALLK